MFHTFPHHEPNFSVSNTTENKADMPFWDGPECGPALRLLPSPGDPFSPHRTSQINPSSQCVRFVRSDYSDPCDSCYMGNEIRVLHRSFIMTLKWTPIFKLYPTLRGWECSKHLLRQPSKHDRSAWSLFPHELAKLDKVNASFWLMMRVTRANRLCAYRAACGCKRLEAKAAPN